MKITYTMPLKDFNFWGPAAETVRYLTRGELELIENYLDKLYPEITAGELNNIISYYWDEIIAPYLGISEEQIYEREPF